MPTASLTLIGWKESIDLPEWGIKNITAKTDTGARRSAIDVKRIVELPGNKIKFDVVVHRKGIDTTRTIVAAIAHQTHVRSSNGQKSERYFVETAIQVGDVSRRIELSLTCRQNMNCRMLLGRKALEGAFLVDVSKSFITRPNRKAKLLPATTH